jgi:hypothetical protein
MEQPLEHFFYYDIETIPKGDKPTDEELKDLVPKNYKKEESIQKWINTNREEIYKKRALDSLEGRLVSIGIAVDDNASEPSRVKIIPYHEDEKFMIDQLAKFIIEQEGYPSYGWVGKNNKEFDHVWLMHRFMKYGFKRLLIDLPSEGRDDRIKDIQDKFAFTGWKQHWKMDKMCEFLGINDNNDEKGNRVYDMFIKGDFEGIYFHNREDVVKNYKIFNMF